MAGGYLGEGDSTGMQEWTWTVKASACRWVKGDAGSVAGQEATVQAKWENGKLSLIAKEGGFLWYGSGFHLRVVWVRDGQQRTEATIEGQDHAAWLFLVPPWGGPPENHDQLELTHVWNDPENGWEVHFELAFSSQA